MKYKQLSRNINKWVNIYQAIVIALVLSLMLLHLPLISDLSSLLSHFSSPAYAAGQKLRVSPVIIPVNLSPGKTTHQKVTIENLSNRAVPLRATLHDFETENEDGGYIFPDTTTNPLLSWIKLDNDEFILSPHEKQTITMTITTPKAVPIGGYYGILFFEPVVQNTTSKTTQVSAKVGVVMLANIGIPDPHAQNANILSFDTGFLHQTGDIPLLVRVQNTSLNFFTAKPILTVTPIFPIGSVQKPAYLEEKVIFPGKVRRWEKDNVITGLTPNLYKVHLTVATGSNRDSAEDRYILVFPLAESFMVITGIFVLMFLFIKRKRLKAFTTELLK